MPGLIASEASLRKRKRVVNGDSNKDVKPRKAPKQTTKAGNTQSRILELEEEIFESQEHYNNIVELQSFLAALDAKPKSAVLAAVSLCRVFCRMIAGERLITRKNASEADIQIVQWLKQRLRDYVASILGWIGSEDATQETTALTLLMRIVKEEVSQDGLRGEQAWKTEKSTFSSLVACLLEKADADAARQVFVEKYVEEYDDVRYYAFVVIKSSLGAFVGGERSAAVTQAINLLSQIEGIPETEEDLKDWYGPQPRAGHQLLSLHHQHKTAQEAWLAIFRSRLTHHHRKEMLRITAANILPWFNSRIELLTDFLTDSFNEGGSLALLALSGIFNLMTKRNLDYPDFYTKLYSLLDDQILHSKHRSRFLRLLNTFLSSSHLPAALVASFVKRLSRLALQAPPGAIVWIVPWTYNMLKDHPACTFMLHRPFHPAHAIYDANKDYQDQGIDDVFSMSENDPMATSAIDSSLWELHMLQTHYHPNVATLAKILGEQFTKRDYTLEDFLDHSYQSLVGAELGKELKKVPVTEWEIPKRIVTEEAGGLSPFGVLLQSAIDVQQ